MLLEVSYSSSSDMRSCPKKFYYRNILGLQQKKKASSLRIGSTIHECFEMFFLHINAQDVINHIDDVYKKLLLNANEIEAEDYLIEKYICLGMWVNYPFNEMEFQEVVPEKKFRVKLGDRSNRGIYLTGTVDGLVKRDGKWWIREVKTTSQEREAFQRNAAVSYQASGYIYGIEKMLGIDICGVVYDYIRKPKLRKGVKEDAQAFADRIFRDYCNEEKKESYYDRYYSYRSTKEIQEYEKDMLMLAKEIRLSSKTGQWGRNTEACYDWNRECPYKKICWIDSPEKGMLDALYTKSSR